MSDDYNRLAVIVIEYGTPPGHEAALLFWRMAREFLWFTRREEILAGAS